MVNYGKFCGVRDNFPILWSFLFGDWYLGKDWAQIWLEVLLVKHFQEFHILESAQKGWSLFKVILFSKDAINIDKAYIIWFQY